MEKVIVFGTGKYYQDNKEKIASLGYKIIGFLDNNYKGKNAIFEGVNVFKPEKVVNIKYNKIIIMSMFKYEMVNQLLELGVNIDDIYVYDVYKSECIKVTKEYYPIKFRNKNNGRKILLISHELSCTGAPIALKYAVQVIKENGDIPIVMSPSAGPLLDEFLNMGIDVVLESGYSLKHGRFKEIIDDIDLIIVNTMHLSNLVQGLLKQLSIPILWWIHEGESFYNIANKDTVSRITGNIAMYCVSHYIKNIWEKVYTNFNIEILLYGIPDLYNSMMKDRLSDKIIFSIVGTIDNRKAQDIFIKAILNMPLKFREQCKFRIIGKVNEKEYYEGLVKMSSEIDQLEFIDEVPNNMMYKYYLDSDVIVSTSRDDPMPVVLSEGMMFSKPCICSKNTGTSFLIRDGEDGFTFQSEDYKELSKKMIYCIENRNKIEYIGKKSREIYDKNFKYDTFSNNLINIIRQLLGEEKLEDKELCRE